MSLITVRQPNYQIAAAYNNTAGFRVLEGYQPVGDTRAFAPVRTWPNYDPGDIQIDGLGLDAYDGYPTTAWLLAFCTPIQDAWLSDTYCSGGRCGLVTIRTLTSRFGTFANFNAVLRLPKLVDSSFIANGRNIAAYKLTFTRLVGI